MNHVFAPMMAVIFALAAAAQNTAPPCEILFNDGIMTDSGVEPAFQTGVKMTDGHTGHAVECVKGIVLAYPAEHVFDPERGTLSLWVRPNWESAEAIGDHFFWGVDSDPGTENRVVLGFLARDGKGVVYFGGDGALGGLSAPVEWHAGEWHHIMVCWEESSHCRALYIDDRLRHHIRVSGMPQQQKVFHIGSLPCVTRWSGLLEGHEADAAIDDVRIAQTVDGPDFDRVRQAAVEDDKASMACQHACEQARPAYESAWERLQQAPTLDGVAEQHIEVAWNDLLGLASPMSQRVPIQARYHPDAVLVHPDLSIALGRANESYGIGFAMGDPFRLPDAYTVTRGLHNGYQPIVESEWKTETCVVHQTAFTLLPRDQETDTGKEPQYLIVRMTVRNTTAEARVVPLFLLLGEMEGTQNTNYAPFTGSASRWMAATMNVKAEGDALTLDGKALLAYKSNIDMHIEFLPQWETAATDPLHPTALTNGIRCNLALKPNETGTLDLVVAGTSCLFPAEELDRMREITFETALARAETYWESGLASGMKLTTPEPRLNDIYRFLILSCLENVTKDPERPWHVPYQFPGWDGVWPWECAHMIDGLCSVGFHRELEPTLRYFTERQTGLGAYAEPGRGPEGDVKCTHGCYSGNFLLRWMNETGSVLWAMASKYRYSHDTEWLKQNKESMLAAWDWIQGERARTRRFADSGEKAGYYGLLPKGRVHDWNEWHHFFFSDTYSWKGMDEMAAAFRSARFPEAERLTNEAGEYRQCILEAIDKAQFVDPETGLLFVPNLVSYQEGERGGLWWADGPSCMFSTGLLDARTDTRFEPMFQYLQQTWGTLMGLTNRMDEPKELGKKNPFWYVNSCERGYFQNFLARGEIEKAILIFYSNLVYGLSNDCYQTVERIHVSDANYAPFQPDASGNGRMLDMFRRMIIDEQEPGVIWLLRGCPRRWFAPGQSIMAENAPTYDGTMACCCHSGDSHVTIDIDPPQGASPRELRVVVRHPTQRPPAKVTVNGEAYPMTDETVAIQQPKGHLQIVCTY